MIPVGESEKAPVADEIDIAVIPNNAVVLAGRRHRLGVRWIDYESRPVTAEIVVMERRGEDNAYEVSLGETFPVGDETWYFADVDFESADRWHVTARRVREGEPRVPPKGRIWQAIQLEPFGRLDEAQLRALEATLHRKLPPNYRDWLGQTNGAKPAANYTVAQLPFRLTPHCPLLGVHPEYQPWDLVAAQRPGRLPPDYLIIARPSGGTLVVKCASPDEDSIWILPQEADIGPDGPADAAVREKRLVYLAQDIGYFLGRLEPWVPRADLPPAELGAARKFFQRGSSPPPKTPTTPEPLLLPVGEFFGTSYPPLGSDERYHRVRMGGEVWEFEDYRFTLWGLLHGLPDKLDEQPWGRTVARYEAYEHMPLELFDAMLDSLFAGGLAVEVFPDSDEAVEFARRHRMVPRMLGLGNSAEQPWLYSIGFFGHPVVTVTRIVYDLWERTSSGESLWTACEALADEERRAGSTDPELVDPKRMLAGVLADLHRLLVTNVVYLEPLA